MSGHTKFDPDHPHWLGGYDYRSGVVNDGFQFCRVCAEIVVFCGLAEFVDGGWGDASA